MFISVNARAITVRNESPIISMIIARRGVHGISGSVKQFVKIAGKNRKWECMFFDADKSICRIHSKKPLECRVLKCWNTSQLIELIGKNYLTRLDLIENSNPLRKCIMQHEKLCSYSKVNGLITSIINHGKRQGSVKELSTLIENDLQFREKMVKQFNLTLNMELFCFGRPLFQVIDYEKIIKNR